jgi:hypothetical protein
MSTYFVSVTAGDHNYRKRFTNKQDALTQANHLLSLYRKPRRRTRFGDGYIRVECIGYDKVIPIATSTNFT